MSKSNKDESILEKVEEKVKKVAKEVVEEVKEIAKKVEDVIEEEIETLTPKKSSKLKSVESSDKADKLAKLKAKAEKLAGKIKSEDSTELKKKVKETLDEEGKYLLAPIEDYLKSSIHLGTRAITPDMRPFVYKRRADSLAVFNTSLLDEKLKESADYLAQFPAEEILIVCKRESGHKAVELFSQVTGIKSFTKNYPAGILTNSNLENFMERELMFVCDPWTDKSAMDDAGRIKIPILAICDTNNYTKGVTKILPGNNKSAKSLGFIFYILAKIYVEKRKLKTEVPPVSEWVDNWDNLVPPK